jgi:hypothetical protein
MNELQIRLTADIKDLQSALAKAKQTLKSFETETSTDSEKSNVGFRRKIGLIEQLNAKAKQLKVSLAQATNEQQIASFNAELEQTNIELTRLNALGKTFANSSTQSFNKFRVSAGAAGGSAIAFNRIIQDAPFGIIGVGNNIQQFSEQLGALRTTTGSTGAALSTFFRSLFTGSNLVILAVSAITAALTAYQLGAFDSAEETKDLAQELEDYKNTLDNVTKAQLEGAQSAQTEIQALKLLRLQAENVALSEEKRLLAVQKIKEEFPDYFKGLTDEEILLGKVGDAYDKVTASITAQAKAKAFSEQITENEKKTLALLLQEEQRALEILAKRTELEKATRLQTSRLENANQFTATDITVLRIQNELNDLIQKTTDSAEERKKIAEETLSIESKIPEQIEKAGGLIDANKEKVKKAVPEVEFYDEVWNENEKRLLRIIELTGKVADEIPDRSLVSVVAFPESDPNKFKPTDIPADVAPLGKIEELEKQISLFESLKKSTQDTGQIALYTLQIDLLKNKLAELNGEEVKSNLEIIADAFGSMGVQIANSLGISNRALRGFVTSLVSATPKIIGAILDQAKAKAQGASISVLADKKESLSGAIKLGVKAAEALGPVGLAILPVFIAGALALIGGAFSKIGGGGGGGAPSAGQGTTFGNRREFGGPVSKGRPYIVGEKRPELFVPNTNGIIVPQVPSMDYSGASVSSGMYGVEVMLKGPDDLLFFVEQAQIRRGIR